MTNTKKLVNPVDDVMDVIASTVEKWKQANNPETIQKRTLALLEKNAETIIVKLLGFDESYSGSWQLDHCNGRSGNSTAGDYIKAVQADVIKEWLSKATMPTLTAKESASITSEMKTVYSYAYWKALKDLVEAKARKDAQTLFDQISSTANQDKYFEMLKLINPTKEENAS